MKIRINVTKEILEKTKSCKARIDSCAVTEAVREIFPRAYTIYSVLHPFPISFKDLGDGIIELPEEATRFIFAFDKCEFDEQRASMQPISFEIEVPDSVINRIGLEEVQKILSESKTLEQVEI